MFYPLLYDAMGWGAGTGTGDRRLGWSAEGVGYNQNYPRAPQMVGVVPDDPRGGGERDRNNHNSPGRAGVVVEKAARAASRFAGERVASPAQWEGGRPASDARSPPRPPPAPLTRNLSQDESQPSSGVESILFLDLFLFESLFLFIHLVMPFRTSVVLYQQGKEYVELPDIRRLVLRNSDLKLNAVSMLSACMWLSLLSPEMAWLRWAGLLRLLR